MIRQLVSMVCVLSLLLGSAALATTYTIRDIGPLTNSGYLSDLASTTSESGRHQQRDRLGVDHRRRAGPTELGSRHHQCCGLEDQRLRTDLRLLYR